MSLFVSFEGGEGTGKSTQASLLTNRLLSLGYRVASVHEPGGTELGDYVRDWVKSTHKPLTAQAELLLFTAARAELVRRVIKPTLDKGGLVIADRFADSTTVYQGYARQIPMDAVAAANNLATAGVWPTLTILLDAPNGAGLSRTRLQASFNDKAEVDKPGRLEEADARRFEEATPDFHKRVREGYLELAQEDPARWLVLNAEQTVDEVAAAVWQRVDELLADREAAARTPGRLPGL